MTSVQVFLLGYSDGTLYANDIWFHSEVDCQAFIKSYNFLLKPEEFIIIPVTIQVPTKFLPFFQE